LENTIQPLNRVFLELGPITIYWYGLIIGTAVFLGLMLATTEGKKLGLHKDLFLDLILYAVPIAVICARIYYVLFNLEYYTENPSEIIKIWEGGIAIHGALIGAIVTTIVFAKKRNVSFWKIADIAAPSLLIGQMMGRWGNFMNQEAHGGEVSRSYLEGLNLPQFIINQMYIEGTYYHPTFLYESLWSACGVILLLILRRKNLLRGEVFLSYLVWYSIGRFFVEHLRTDSLMLFDTIRIAQLVSAVTIILGLALIFYRRYSKTETKRYNQI
jgi:phosphatidylglycerol:prolipoprotein diacylglycerol transferase